MAFTMKRCSLPQTFVGLAEGYNPEIVIAPI